MHRRRPIFPLTPFAFMVTIFQSNSPPPVRLSYWPSVTYLTLEEKKK